MGVTPPHRTFGQYKPRPSAQTKVRLFAVGPHHNLTLPTKGVDVCLVVCLFLHISSVSKTSVGARGHTTGRILRRLL